MNEDRYEAARKALAEFESEVLEGQASHAWNLGDALRALIEAPGEIEWADGLLHDDTHEFTVSSDCDGTNAIRWRRRPRRVTEAGLWERVENGDG